VDDDSASTGQQALLDMFAVLTDLPIGLFESTNQGIRTIFSGESNQRYSPYCKAVRALPGAAALCDADEMCRAEDCMRNRSAEPVLCHAGLYNIAVPIQVGGRMRGALLFGQAKVEGESHTSRALERQESFFRKHRYENVDVARLREAYAQCRSFPLERLMSLKNALPSLERWFFGVLDEEGRAKHEMFTIVHDIQTRLQAMLARAENLSADFDNPSEVKKESKALLDSALALDTVIQTLGYVGSFRFKDSLIAPLINESIGIYQREARQRGIDIRLNPTRPGHRIPLVSVSRLQLQYALNNLIHNAIKYSYRGGPGRQRWVDIYVSYSEREEECSISISNYGIGILEEEKRRIFEKGYQGKLRENEYRTGAGQGLFFVKQMIDAHHGRIEVDSRPVSDSTSPNSVPYTNRFTIILPYRQPGEPENADHSMD
jgi:signal transduction histidine kinase